MELEVKKKTAHTRQNETLCTQEFEEVPEEGHIVRVDGERYVVEEIVWDIDSMDSSPCEPTVVVRTETEAIQRELEKERPR